MVTSDKGDASKSRYDPLIDAAVREILGDADPPSSAVVLSKSTTDNTVTSDSDDHSSKSNRTPIDKDIGTYSRIAQYHVKRRIASGAMGTVFEATQEHPRRTVAVKVMKHGIASRRAVRRFEDESQILARLNHPGIAKVYEAGWHEEGDTRVPFFALEYIPHAEPIIDYANHRQLSVRDRIRLFVSVCHAIHHGHQRGVIHRDIKPGNILVDSNGQMKVIDFGVARSTDSDLNLTSLQTVVGEIVGTLKYMSPEQCHADPHDLDIRSDIYSLGVVLFELLAGRAPYDLSTTPFVAIPKMICEEPPARLSAVDRSLRGDLEMIVHKALEKDRQHRYQSALALAEDLERYMNNEPILARPPSAVYQFRKLVRRRRVPLAVATVLFVLGIVVAAASVRLAAERTENERLAFQLAVWSESAAFLDFQDDADRRAKTLELCNKVLQVDGHNSNALALRARVRYLNGAYPAAGKDCAAALRIDSKNKLAMRTCAAIELDKGNFGEARKLYEAGLAPYVQTGDLARDFYNRARLRRRDGDCVEAMTDSHRAVALAPSEGQVFKGRGITRYMCGDWDRALEDLTRAASIREGRDGRAAQCNLWIWEIYVLRDKPGDQEEADRAIHRAAAAATDPRAKGIVEVLRGHQDADTHLATLKRPDDIAQANYYLGVKALVEKNREDAIAHFRKADDPSLNDHVEYDLAQWHLARLESK